MSIMYTDEHYNQIKHLENVFLISYENSYVAKWKVVNGGTKQSKVVVEMPRVLTLELDAAD